MSRRPVTVITGASGGIGTELAALHAREGWDVVMVNRSAERSQPIIARLRADHPAATIDLVQADLADNDSIAAAADALLQRGHVDLFYNNAGVLLDKAVPSKHGVEMHAQVHVIAPYLFGRLLHPVLDGSSMVTVTTGGIKNAKTLRVDDLANPPSFKKLFGPYVHSKLAGAALLDAFSREYPATTFRSVEPGAVKSEMTAGAGMPRWLMPIRNLFFSAPEKGAQRVYDAATSNKAGAPSGAFVMNGKVTPLRGNASDPDIQASLIAWCSEITGA
ncbi:MAG: SDR family NAD(P)-dependent oxidoreductase [Ilumatobacter sp.]